MRSPPHAQRGFSLLELLVAFVIMAMSLAVLYRASGGTVSAALAVERQGQAAQAIEAAQLMLTVAAREAEMRTGRAEADVQAEAKARAAWAGLIAARFGEQADPQRMRGALADLRRLREINATRLNLERQIHGMEADQAAFLEALADLALDLGEIADLPPEARMRAIETQGAAARAAQDRWQSLGDEVETAKAHLAEVATARASVWSGVWIRRRARPTRP